MFGIVITSGIDTLSLSHVAAASRLLSLSEGLETLWGLGLFIEVVFCLQRRSPLVPKFNVSSCSVHKLRSIAHKKAFYSTPPTLQNGMPNIMMYFSGVNCFLSSAMSPPLGLYMFDLLLTHNRMFVALPCWGPNANCILVGSQQGHSWRPKEAGFCLVRVCLCSHVLRLLRTVQLRRCSLHQDHQKNNSIFGVTETGLKTWATPWCVWNIT